MLGATYRGFLVGGDVGARRPWVARVGAKRSLPARRDEPTGEGLRRCRRRGGAGRAKACRQPTTGLRGRGCPQGEPRQRCGQCDALTNTEGSQRQAGGQVDGQAGQNDADDRPGRLNKLVQRSSRTTPARVCRVRARADPRTAQ